MPEPSLVSEVQAQVLKIAALVAYLAPYAATLA